MNETQEPYFTDSKGVSYFPRKITRLVRPWLHIEGHSGSNCRGDIDEMLQEGILSDRDVRILTHIRKCCIRLSEAQPDGLVVSMSHKQYASFIGIRRRFIEEKRDRLYDSLKNFKTKSIKIENHQ